MNLRISPTLLRQGMIKMESKNDRVRRLVRSDMFKEALQICKDWNYENPQDREQLRRGYECLMYPRFYKQIGIDPAIEYNKAVIVLLRVYG